MTMPAETPDEMSDEGLIETRETHETRIASETGETIVALASGALPAAIAVIRVCGPCAAMMIKTLAGRLPPPRRATLCALYGRDRSRQNTRQEANRLDEAIVVWFPGPASYTGEDLVEIQTHGGEAVVAAVLGALLEFDGVRLAQPGEFTRRAFENGRMDLTAIEGLADLIEAQTEQQRVQALRQSRGALDTLYETWRNQLVRMGAHLMAAIDFADEDDVPGGLDERVRADIVALRAAVSAHLADAHYGEIVREGLQVAIMGPPNAGKSSLLNWLARRDVAIVTPHAGTTRDLLEVRLNIDGHLVVVTDTAGIREGAQAVEREGIRRALDRGRSADVVLWLEDASCEDVPPPVELDGVSLIRVANKADLLDRRAREAMRAVSSKVLVSVAARTDLDRILTRIKEVLARLGGGESSLLPTRMRHRAELSRCLDALREVLDDRLEDAELVAEGLRVASDALGRLTGRIDVEDLLDVVFAEFCIGK